MKRFWLNRELRLGIFLAITFAALLAVTQFGSRGDMNTLTEFLYLLALAQLWNLLAGYAGLVSVGQQAWIGLGAYTMLVCSDDFGLPIVVGILLAGLVSAAIAYPTALITFRLRGGYFAIGTWVIAEVIRLLVTSNTGLLGGGTGRTLNVRNLFDSPSQRITLVYIIAILIAFGVILFSQYLLRSKRGLGLTAIRDNEEAATSLGISTYNLKLFIFIACAFGTGVVGSLIAMNQLSIVPKSIFSINWTSFMIFIVVIGGIGTLEGPIIGTIVFFLLREYLSSFGEWSFIILGAVAVIMMLVAPQGLWGLVKQRFNFELFPVRRLIPKKLIDSSSEITSPKK